LVKKTEAQNQKSRVKPQPKSQSKSKPKFRPKSQPKPKVVIVTGLSGAGRSTALRALEDLGYEAVDNLPLALLPDLVLLKDDNPEHFPAEAVAIGIDTRTRAFRADNFAQRIAELKARGDHEIMVVFLDCNNDSIARRFSENRRRHPMALDRPVIDGVQRERQIMEPLRASADFIFDTTDLAVKDLRGLMQQNFSLRQTVKLTITLSSFAYPRGLPRDADLVFDVRFLRNPHYDLNLRPLTGLDARIVRYIEADPSFSEFFAKVGDLVLSLLPKYEREGKAYLNIAFGCTGGRHRSVTVAEEVAQLLRTSGYRVSVLHREIGQKAEAIEDAAQETR
jgi:UPF0042 nucleotide-binding protein